jgi:hypothetical protein
VAGRCALVRLAVALGAAAIACAWQPAAARSAGGPDAAGGAPRGAPERLAQAPDPALFWASIRERVVAFNALVERAKRASGVLQSFHGLYGRSCEALVGALPEPGNPLRSVMRAAALNTVSLLWSEGDRVFWVFIGSAPEFQDQSAPIARGLHDAVLTWTDRESRATERRDGQAVTLSTSAAFRASAGWREAGEDMEIVFSGRLIGVAGQDWTAMRCPLAPLPVPEP